MSYPAAFTLPVWAVDIKQVGTRYHLALGLINDDGTETYRYGYMLKPGTEFSEDTDLNSKSKLTSYSSANTTDRDFVNWPRVSQQDFTEGGQQIIHVNPKRYWTSTLDPTYPGQLRPRPAWVTTQVDTGQTKSNIGSQVIAFGATAYASFGGARYYNIVGTAFTPNGISTVLMMAEDGAFAYICDGTGVFFTATPETAGSWARLTTGVPTGVSAWTRMWTINLGTAGRWLYLAGTVGSGSTSALFRVDLSKMVSGAPNIPYVQVPLGTNSIGSTKSWDVVADVVEYQGGVAIAMVDPDFRDATVWYHDGTSMSRILDMPHRAIGGMCVTQGDLYVSVFSPNSAEAPSLIRIAGGSAEVVALQNLGPNNNTTTWAGQPVANTDYVYWPGSTSSDGSTGYKINSLYQYSIRTGGLHLLPPTTNSFSAGVSFTNPLDDVTAGFQRRLTLSNGKILGGEVASNGTTYSVVYQSVSSPGSNLRSGDSLTTSVYDFGTPAVDKLFRRVKLEHSPIPSGGNFAVTAYANGSPVDSSGTQVGTITNSVVNSTITTLRINPGTLARGMYLVVSITPDAVSSAPYIKQLTVEATVAWTIEFTVACTNRRQDLSQNDDDQPLTGKDLYALMHNAWEDPKQVRLYHPNGNSYICEIENASFKNYSPERHPGVENQTDYEAWGTFKLRIVGG